MDSISGTNSAHIICP